MTFAGEEPLKETMRLSMEVDSLEKETKDFNNIMLTRTNEDAAEGRSSASLAKQKGVISSRIIPIKKGEKLTVSLQAKYDNEEVLQDLKPLSKSATIGKVLGNSAALLAIQDVNIGNESKYKSLNINILAAIPLLKNLFSKRKNKDDITIPYKPQKPQGYVEIAVYKDSLLSELLTVQRKYISENSEFSWQTLQDSLSFETDGFAVVSLRNESDKNVLFDDLTLRTYGTQKARIIQENHYEPFGMTLQGLDYVAEDTRGNRFLYNGGVERQEELGLYWDDSHARGYNMQNGRFEQIDPLSEKYTGITGYNFSFNNPVNLNDPSGLEPDFSKNFDITSTHTDKDGTVLAVYDDGDLGVYKHNDAKTKADIDAKHSATNTSADGQRMGRTLHTFSFVDGAELQKGNIVAKGRINFGSNWAERAVQRGLERSWGIGHYGLNAGNNEPFDLKTSKFIKEDNKGEYFGSVIFSEGGENVFASARDAGNFLAGAKAAKSIFPTELFIYGFGAYNASGNSVKETPFTILYDMFYSVLGTPILNPPTYGEDYQSHLGIQAGTQYHANFSDNGLTIKHRPLKK